MKRFMTRRVRLLMVAILTFGQSDWFYLENLHVQISIGVVGYLIVLPIVFLSTLFMTSFFLLFAS